MGGGGEGCVCVCVAGGKNRRGRGDVREGRGAGWVGERMAPHARPWSLKRVSSLSTNAFCFAPLVAQVRVRGCFLIQDSVQSSGRTSPACFARVPAQWKRAAKRGRAYPGSGAGRLDRKNGLRCSHIRAAHTTTQSAHSTRSRYGQPEVYCAAGRVRGVSVFGACGGDAGRVFLCVVLACARQPPARLARPRRAPATPLPMPGCQAAPDQVQGAGLGATLCVVF